MSVFALAAQAETTCKGTVRCGGRGVEGVVVTDGEHFEKYAGAGAIKQYAAAHMAQ